MKTVGYIILIESKAMRDKTSKALSYGHPNESSPEMLLRRGRATLFKDYQEAERALKDTLLAAQNCEWPEKFIYKIVAVESQAIEEASENGLYREGYRNGYGFGEAAGKQQALAEAEKQEPVAWMREDEDCTDCFVWEQTEEHTIALYTHPPQRQPLTDEQIDEIYFKSSLEVDNRSEKCEDIYDFARAIEAAHGIGD